MNSINERISNLRKLYRLTQSQLADALHVSSKLVSKWENNSEGAPGLEDINNIANYFNVSIDYLVNGIIREGDKKALNRKPTTGEYYEDCKVRLKAFLKEYKMLKYFDALYDNLKAYGKIDFALCCDSKPYKRDQYYYWETEDILKFNDFDLYKLLLDKKYVKELDHKNEDLLTKLNVTDIRFYTDLNWEERSLYTMLRDFELGKREWSDLVILTLIDLGAYIRTHYSTFCDDGYDHLQDNIMLTKLLRDYCARNLEKDK